MARQFQGRGWQRHSANPLRPSITFLSPISVIRFVEVIIYFLWGYLGLCHHSSYVFTGHWPLLTHWLPPGDVSLALSNNVGFSHTKTGILLFLNIRFFRVSLSLSHTHAHIPDGSEGSHSLSLIYLWHSLSCHWITSVSMWILSNTGPETFFKSWIFQEGGNRFEWKSNEGI